MQNFSTQNRAREILGSNFGIWAASAAERRRCSGNPSGSNQGVYESTIALSKKSVVRPQRKYF
jgi:hypothetical protein